MKTLHNLLIKHFNKKVEELTFYPKEVTFDLVKSTKWHIAPELCFIVGALSMMIIMMSIFTIDFPFLRGNGPYVMFYALGFIFGSGIIVGASVKILIPLIDWGFISLHNLLPQRSERESVVVTFWDAHLRELNPYYTHNFRQELEDLGLKEFCHKYFNKSGSGFLRFMEARIKAEFGFIYYALSIPRVKDLSVDALRKILLAYPGDLRLDGPLKLEHNFSLYTLSEIEEIFTSLSDKEIIKQLAEEEVYPVAKNFNELRTKDIPGYLLALDGKETEGFKFQVLKNKADYHYVGSEFQNCVAKLWLEYGFFLVGRSSTEKICLYIEKGVIQEMKLAENLPVPSPDRIYKMLAPYKISEKKNFFKRLKSLKLGRSE